MVDLDPMLRPVRDLGSFIRDQREAANLSIRALAAKTGVSNPYLSQVERGVRRPSAHILAQIAHGLSISAETLLAQAGVLDREAADEVTAGAGSSGLGASAEAQDTASEASRTGTAGPSVLVAIAADPRLTPAQRSALRQTYLAFVAAGEPAAPSAGPPAGETHSSTPSTAATE